VAKVKYDQSAGTKGAGKDCENMPLGSFQTSVSIVQYDESAPLNVYFAAVGNLPMALASSGSTLIPALGSRGTCKAVLNRSKGCSVTFRSRSCSPDAPRRSFLDAIRPARRAGQTRVGALQ
jgi:hypothetical protein